MLTHQENDKTDEENDAGNYITTNDRERASEFLKNRREKTLNQSSSAAVPAVSSDRLRPHESVQVSALNS